MIERKTIFSDDRKYRYTLWREWPFEFAEPVENRPPRGYVNFICLNPSTADEKTDDPTIRRCIQFTKDWGFSAMCMTNLFGWRDTDPEKMKLIGNPNGIENDYFIGNIAFNASIIVAGWGRHGKHLHRGVRVKMNINEMRIGGITGRLQCLGVNSDGTPKHPLYLKANTELVPYV